MCLRGLAHCRYSDECKTHNPCVSRGYCSLDDGIGDSVGWWERCTLLCHLSPCVDKWSTESSFQSSWTDVWRGSCYVERSFGCAMLICEYCVWWNVSDVPWVSEVMIRNSIEMRRDFFCGWEIWEKMRGLEDILWLQDLSYLLPSFLPYHVALSRSELDSRTQPSKSMP